MRNRILSLALSLLMLASVVPAAYAAEADAGTGLDVMPISAPDGAQPVDDAVPADTDAEGLTGSAYVTDPADYDMLANWLDPRMPIGMKYHETAARLAEDAIEAAGAETDYDALKAVCNWIAGNVRFHVPTACAMLGIDCPEEYAGQERAHLDVDALLDGGYADCNDYCAVAIEMLGGTGIPMRIVGGRIDGFEGPQSWIEAFVDGRWAIVDIARMAMPCVGDDGALVVGQVDDAWFDVDPAVFIGSYTYSRLNHVETSRDPENVPSDWARAYVLRGFQEGLVPYVLAGDYRDDVTREEFCGLMIGLIRRCSDLELRLPEEDPFEDTDDEDVLIAYGLGIVSGTSETTFEPDRGITRQEAAVMLSRTARILGLEAQEGIGFDDLADAADWAREHVLFVSGLMDADGVRVINGIGDGLFAPLGSYTKEQCFVTLMHLFDCAVSPAGKTTGVDADGDEDTGIDGNTSDTGDAGTNIDTDSEAAPDTEG